MGGWGFVSLAEYCDRRRNVCAVIYGWVGICFVGRILWQVKENRETSLVSGTSQVLLHKLERKMMCGCGKVQCAAVSYSRS